MLKYLLFSQLRKDPIFQWKVKFYVIRNSIFQEDSSSANNPRPFYSIGDAAIFENVKIRKNDRSRLIALIGNQFWPAHPKVACRTIDIQNSTDQAKNRDRKWKTFVLYSTVALPLQWGTQHAWCDGGFLQPTNLQWTISSQGNVVCTTSSRGDREIRFGITANQLSVNGSSYAITGDSVKWTVRIRKWKWPHSTCDRCHRSTAMLHKNFVHFVGVQGGICPGYN